jgi:pyruvate kinase
MMKPPQKSALDLRLNQLPETGTHTKIVCTIGPSTDTPEKLAELLHHGMSVARLNFSHAGSDYTYPESILNHVRAAIGKHKMLHVGSGTSSSSSSSIGHAMPNNLRAILVDTKGPEIRTGVLQGKAEVLMIHSGSRVELTLDDVSQEPAPKEGDENAVLRIQIDYQSICHTVDIGKHVLLDDGLIALEVVEIDPNGKFIVCTALNEGPIKKNKGVNLPGMELDLPALTEKDKRDLKWACEVGADFVAASFIRNAANVRSVKAYLDRCIVELSQSTPLPPGDKARLRPLVISKIENKEGMDGFDEILVESDGIMVARGDLGVEIPYSKVFAAQRMMVQKCNAAGKPVIVATQMLDSMIRNPRPTRAEVTDVGTAVLDGADAVM